MVALDPQPARGNGDVERQRAVVTARVKIMLVEDFPIDGDAAAVVATYDAITRHTDDPLDEILLAGRRKPEVAADLAQLAKYRVMRRGDAAFRRPGIDAAEDDDLASVNMADLVGEPVDDHSVTDVQRVLHRPSRNEECLEQEGVHADRNNRSDDE